MATLTSCGGINLKPGTDREEPVDNLKQFALAECFAQYLEEGQYNTEDIRAIAGGYVEMGTRSLETYETVSQAVKEFQPNIPSKQNIDNNLLKCFYLDRSEAVQNAITQTSSSQKGQKKPAKPHTNSIMNRP